MACLSHDMPVGNRHVESTPKTVTTSALRFAGLFQVWNWPDFDRSLTVRVSQIQYIYDNKMDFGGEKSAVANKFSISVAKWLLE